MSYAGVIKSFNQQKGWGFIECEETHQMYGKDIFVMKSALEGRIAQKGQFVNFDVVEGDNGPQGANLEFQGAPEIEAMPRPTIGKPRAISNGQAVQAGRHRGVVKSFNPQKGWGFIECDETREIYGKDMFILKSNLPAGRQDIAQGEQVSFTVAQTPTGPHAQEVQMVSRGGGGGGKGPSMQIGGGGKGGMAPPPGGCGGPPPDHIGTVKSVNVDKGYGFVTSPTLVQLYGKDIFFQLRDLMYGAVHQGEQVAFSVTAGQKGPMAVSLQPFQPMGAYMSQSVGSWGKLPAPPPPMNMGPPRNWGPPPPPRAAPAMGKPNQIFFGTVKTINAEKGWGHVECQAVTEQFGKDAFLRRSELENGLEIGVQVSFRIELAAKGPQAVDVHPLPDGSFDGVFEGKVKSFNAEKGWGFLTSPEVQSTFGKDIFVHKRELGDEIPSAGAAVQFSVEQGRNGQLEARNVSISQGPVIGVPGSGYGGAKKGAGKGARAAPY